MGIHDTHSGAQPDHDDDRCIRRTAVSEQVENELVARAAVTPAALHNGRIEGAHSIHALTQAVVASNLALLDEQKRTNRLLIAAHYSSMRTSDVKRIESEMDANAASLKVAN